MTEDEESEKEQQCAQCRTLLRIVEKQLQRVQEQVKAIGRFWSPVLRPSQPGVSLPDL